MHEIQFWSISHRKILRVQQSMNGPYRVVSIPPDKAEVSYTSEYSVPKWSHNCKDRKLAEGELRIYAHSRHLDVYKKDALPERPDRAHEK